MPFKQNLASGAKLAGTFVKTPSSEIVEILALAGVDFICLDAEHSAFGRRELDTCLALARALGLPALVRLSHASPQTILQALDSGAAGVVVPHVRTAAQASEIARWAHFGQEGRGYAGSTRAAGFTTRPMREVLARTGDEILVIAQIEDPSALEEVEEIAATEGVDALFFGAADLAVGMGLENSAAPQVQAAFTRVLAAAGAAGKPLAAYCANADGVAAQFEKGVRLVFAASDQSAVLAYGRALATARDTSLKQATGA